MLPSLPAPDPIQEKFDTFHTDNPHVFTEIETLALTAHRKGVKRLGIATIFEVLRYNLALKTQGDRFKLNNNFRALYARQLVTLHPELTTMFETRRRISVE